MPKKLVAAAVLAALVVAMATVGFALAPSSAIRPIAADSLCPAAGCASGLCHGCTSVECHGWDSLIGRYHQASDMSLNVWILMPVALVLGLWLLVRRMGRLGRVHDDSRADDGMAEASSPVAPSERHCAENLMTAGEEGACYEA